MGVSMRNFRHYHLLAIAFLGTSDMSWGAGMEGGESLDSQETSLETITVTARRREESLWDVPGSVQVESGGDLERKRLLDGASVLHDIEGASVGTFGDHSNAFVVMRGVAPILTPLSPDDSSVLTFVDGAPMPLSGSQSQYLDLERVEVAKGPQNTLFGRNTAGGAINLVTRKPTHEFEGSSRVEAGSDGIFRAEAILNGSLVPDELAGRLAIRRSLIDGYISNSAGDDLGEDESWAARGSLLFTPSDRTRWLLAAQGESTDTTPVTYIAYRPHDEAPQAAQTHSTDDIRMLGFNSDLAHDFDDVTAIFQTSYVQLNDHNIYNFPDALIASDFSGFPPSLFLDPDTNFNDWQKHDSRLTQEIRLESQAGASFDWLAGVVFYQDRAERKRNTEMWYFGPAATGRTDYELETNGQAVFGEVSVPLQEQLELSLGGRYTHESKTFESEYSSDGSQGEVPLFSEDGSESYDFLTGRVALTYHWSPELMTWMSVARGYKSGGFGLENSLMWAGVPREPYDSSSVISYELGGRSSWLDNTLEVSGALFFNDMHDEQVQTWDYSNFSGTQLNLDARSAGLELQAQYRPSRYWWLTTGVAYTDAILGDVTEEQASLQTGLATGNRLPTVPEWTARAAIEYQAPGHELGLGGFMAHNTVNARLSYNYIGSRYTDVSNFGKLPPAHLVASRVGVDFGNGEVYLFGENLLDEEYLTIKERFGTDADGNPVFGVSYARGLTFGVGMALYF